MGDGEVETEDKVLPHVSVHNHRHDDSPEVPRSVRHIPPADYTLKIKAFSQLSEVLRKTKAEKYESADFEAGGCIWKLVLYPYGNEKRNGKGHISLFLELSDSVKNPRAPGWEVNVTYSFFVFNHIHDNYLVIPDGRIRSLHSLNAENGLGFPRLLPLSTFTAPLQGYLVDDCCAFGVELRVIKASGKGETISIVKEPKNDIFTWKLENFSTLEELFYNSDVFTAGQCRWMLSIYPKGDSRGKDSLSAFLICASNLQSKVYVEFKLSIKNQLGIGKSHEDEAYTWMDSSSSGWGFVNFIGLTNLEDKSKGLLVNDCVIFEAEIIAVSEIKYEI